MKHDKFRAFKAIESNLNTPEITDFLNHGEIIPRSLSIDRYFGGYVMVVIGYEINDLPGTLEQQCQLLERVIKPFDLSTFGEKLTKEAEALEGIIDLDIRYTGDTILVTFLTTK